MTEQELNGSQIGAEFEEVDGECMSQRMWRNRFGETAPNDAPSGRPPLRRPS